MQQVISPVANVFHILSFQTTEQKFNPLRIENGYLYLFQMLSGLAECVVNRSKVINKLTSHGAERTYSYIILFFLATIAYTIGILFPRCLMRYFFGANSTVSLKQL